MAKKIEKHPEGGWRVGGRKVSSRDKARNVARGKKPPTPNWRETVGGRDYGGEAPD